MLFSSGCLCSTWYVGPPEPVSLCCWALALDYMGKEAQLHLSSGPGGKVQLSGAICRIVTACLNSAEISQKNLRQTLAA